MSDSDTIYALNANNYHLNKNDFEPQHRNQLPEIIKINNMINDNGNVKWSVFVEGDENPTIISHAELHLRNSQLLIDFFHKFLLDNK